jgi:hypothetical protein
MAEAARVLGAAIGKPDLEYVQLPYGHAHAAMVDSGTSASFAAAVMQTASSFNDGHAWDTEPRSSANTTRTTLEQFAHTTFRSAWESALAGTSPGSKHDS